MHLENRIIDLLTSGGVAEVRKFFLTWDEARNASWANAHRQAKLLAPSPGHLPALRGQLRHQLGEEALATAAEKAKFGIIARPTEQPGACMMLARVGRFALTSIKVRHRMLLPRQSLTRTVLSRPNLELDPQSDLLRDDASRSLTELAYFGCLIAVPSNSDPSAPGELCLAVPDGSMRDWLKVLSIETVHGMLLDRAAGSKKAKPTGASKIEDKVIPQIIVPKIEKPGGGN